MDNRIMALWEDLKELQKGLSDHTRDTYQRINPFCEDLFDWKERGEYWLGVRKEVTIYNSTTVVGDVTIGENSWIGPCCTLDGTGGLSIGKFCVISYGSQLLTHDTIKWALSAGVAPYEYASTRIGDCCFLGAYSVIMKGVTIGSHCLIGAGAVVTSDLEDYSINAGVPARRIGTVHVQDDGQVSFEYNRWQSKIRP